MKIGIIGLGIIGGALKYGFEKLGIKVYVHDTKFPDSKIENVLNSEIIYICVPTPSNEDGSCNTSIVESVVDELHELKYEGIISIKSTVIPGTTQKLIDRYNNDKICFTPEFLRERCAISDFTENHELLAIGTNNSFVYDKIVKCHGKYPKNFRKLTPTEAEMLKYYSNVFNALRIIFANEMYELCKSVDANYNNVKDAFVLRKTTTDLYLDVGENFRGYGGMCVLPNAKCKIIIDNKEMIKRIDDLYNIYIKENILPDVIQSTNYDLSNLEWKKINSLTKNIVSEKIYCFETDNGIFKCTKDHLIPIERDGKIVIEQAKNIIDSDKLFCI